MVFLLTHRWGTERRVVSLDLRHRCFLDEIVTVFELMSHSNLTYEKEDCKSWPLSLIEDATGCLVGP